MMIEIDNKDLNGINGTEKKFKRFIDKKGLTAVFLHQSINSFPKNFQSQGAKRPDFCVYSQFGIFYVDIKTSKLDKYTRFTVSVDDHIKLTNAAKILKKSIFLAFTIDPWSKGLDWGFISIDEVNELKEEQAKWINNGHKFIGIEFEELKHFNELI